MIRGALPSVASASSYIVFVEWQALRWQDQLSDRSRDRLPGALARVVLSAKLGLILVSVSGSSVFFLHSDLDSAIRCHKKDISRDCSTLLARHAGQTSKQFFVVFYTYSLFVNILRLLSKNIIFKLLDYS